MRRALVLLLFVVACLLPRTTRAQRVEVNASAEPDTVEVGGLVTYTLQATTVSGDAIETPDPGPHPGFAIRGTSSSPMRMSVNVNGVPSTVQSLTTSWTLQASKLGSFTLGPASIVVSGNKHSGRPVRVTVVPKGQAPPRPPVRGFDPFAGSPFDPFKGFFEDLEPPKPQPTGDPKLALDEPRAPVAFLFARADKKQAVVGEQITLSMYLYSLPDVRLGKARDIHVPTTTDFVRHPLLAEGKEIDLGRVVVGDRLWDVELISKDALFPMKTGRLTIGAMSMSLQGIRGGGYRESQTLQIDVSEPPIAGRPPGYQVGDVGDFALQATVSPRALVQGGSVGVTLELRGTGNLPAHVALPEIAGVEWLDAQQRDALGVMQNDRFGGTRTWSYVAHFLRAGAIDLEEVRIPFFDPDTRAYGVAKASLGIVNVTPGEVRDAGATAAEPILPDLPLPRRTLEGPHQPTFWTEQPAFWAGIFGSPVLCTLAIAGQRIAKRLKEKRANTKSRPDRIARDRIRAAEEACKGEDGKSAASAVARALEATVLARTGVNLRGAAGDAAIAELERASVGRGASEEVVRLLRDCEDARFSPDGVTVAAARALWARANDVFDRLGGGGA